MKEYLGDGCYVEFDGYALVLTTEDGISVQNRVVLEPEVYLALTQFVRRRVEHIREQNAQAKAMQ